MLGYHPRDPVIEGAFQRFSETSVDLGARTTKQGRDIAQSVVNITESQSNLGNNCPSLMKGESFIAGSLGRWTQEQPLDDIDIYLVMNAPRVNAAKDGHLLPLVARFAVDRTPLVDDPLLMVGNAINAHA